MFVLTLDQRRSRTAPDGVPQLLSDLNGRSDLVLPFERTAGDEVQGLVADPAAVTEIVVRLLRGSAWWIGVGIGAVDHPAPTSVRAGRGAAYVAARAAVQAAKSMPGGVAVRGQAQAAPVEAAYIESTLSLLAVVVQRRSRLGWEVVDLMREDLRQVEVAALLGITPQAVSSRLRVAAWPEERGGRRLTTWLLSLSQRDRA